MKATVAHALMALAVTSMIMSPSIEAHANEAQAKRNAKIGMKFFKKEKIILVDAAMGAVQKGGRLVFLTSFIPGLEYMILVDGDNSLQNVALSVHGPKNSKGKFPFIGARGHTAKDKKQPFRIVTFKVTKPGVYGLVMHHLAGTAEGAHGFFLVGIKPKS
jgi:hypothetical protein